MPKELIEAAASALAKSGNRWKVICAVPGKGSSGTYSESVLRDFGPAALPAGSKSYINHDGKRDPRDLLGHFPEGASYEEGVGLVAELEVLPHYKELVEAVAPHTGMSIYMQGESDDEGNVTALIPSRLNSVDLVGYPGLEGSGIVERLYEAARDAAPIEPAVIVAEEEKETNMEKVLEAIEALAESLKPVVAFVSEAATKRAEDAQAEVDQTAVDAAVESALAGYEEKVAAIEAAELLAPQVEALKVEARKGVDVAPLIESAKAIVEAARDTLAGDNGDTHIIESANGEFAFPKGW